jgi:hypothetical protein
MCAGLHPPNGPPATRLADRALAPRHTNGSRNARVREPAPQRAPRLHMPSRVGRQLCAGQGRHISGRPSRHALADREMLMRHATPTGRETKGRQAACAVASSLPDTLADCARPRAHSRRRFSVVQKSVAPTAPCPHVCKLRCDRIPKVGKLPAPSRHCSPTLSQTVRGSRHALPLPCTHGRKIGCAHRPCQHANMPTCVQASV